MYHSKIDYENVHIVSDPITRKSNDNVMGVFYEEQPFTWEIYKEKLLKIHNNISCDIDFLEVGCGSGLWSILFAKYLKGKVFANQYYQFRFVME